MTWKNKTPWTPKAVEMLHALNKKGLSTREIAKEINRACKTGFTKNAVLGKLWRAS